ncbi:V-type H+-transporting ATPase subunit G [Schistosoma bovis]|uniref:V-type proton ATPase subunit G n=2 Tax=Schistosoma TaxID=6181 RepID=A0A430QKS1_SCHBO|nr:V-type H+-transporting ATPase subunit G [Schistosoma bovis]
MASRNDGIQLLLQAEKSASEKVNEAKRRKAKRLKEAKAEAQAEIEAERAEHLETFSRHAKRSTVTVDDVFCFVRRNPQLLQHLTDYHKNQIGNSKQESDLSSETFKTKPKLKAARKKSNLNKICFSEPTKPDEAEQTL